MKSLHKWLVVVFPFLLLFVCGRMQFHARHFNLLLVLLFLATIAMLVLLKFLLGGVETPGDRKDQDPSAPTS